MAMAVAAVTFCVRTSYRVVNKERKRETLEDLRMCLKLSRLMMRIFARASSTKWLYHEDYWLILINDTSNHESQTSCHERVLSPSPSLSKGHGIERSGNREDTVVYVGNLEQVKEGLL